MRQPNIGMPAGSGDRWPEDYERGRPGYPPQAVEIAGLPAPSTVLDLGAGTGKLTRLLLTRALAEIARVLQPRGALALLWNLPAGPAVPSTAGVDQLIEKRAPPDLGYDPGDLNSIRYASGEWRAAFVGSPFEELQETRLPNPQTLTRDEFVAFFASMGWIADLPDADRLPLLDRIRSLLDADEYRRPWETRVYQTRPRV